MAMQSQVYTELCVGVPGQAVTPDQSIYTPINYTAGEGGVYAGSFCYADSETEGLAVAAGSTVLGFVERVQVADLFDTDETGTLLIPEGNAPTIAVKGDYYVVAPGTVAVGDSVYADAESGAVASSGNDTGWTYKTAGEEGDTVIISNWA